MDKQPIQTVGEDKPLPPANKIPNRLGIARKIWISLVFISAFVFICLIFHANILRFVSSYLVQENPLPKGKYAVLLFGSPQWSEAYDHVTRILPEGEPVVLMKGKQTRLMRLGLESPWWQTDIDKLTKKGVRSLDLLEDPSAHYTYQYVPLIAKWLDGHPEKSLCVCHGRFHGRTLSRTLARHLTAEQLQRIALIPVNEPDFDPEQWWRKKEGQAAVIGGYSNLIFDILFGDGEEPGPDWDPKAYEEALG